MSLLYESVKVLFTKASMIFLAIILIVFFKKFVAITPNAIKSKKLNKALDFKQITFSTNNSYVLFSLYLDGFNF